MQAGILDLERLKSKKDRKIILRKEKLKEERKEKKKGPIEVRKVEGEELLIEVTVKTSLERIDIQEGITVKALLDS